MIALKFCISMLLGYAISIGMWLAAYRCFGVWFCAEKQASAESEMARYRRGEM